MRYDGDQETAVIENLGFAYHYYLTGEIKDDINTRCLIKKLKSCSPQDVVSIYLNTPGGNYTTARQIINSIRNCYGRVVTHADGDVASAGSLIFFCGDMLTVADFSSFLIHNGDMMIGGKLNEVMQSAVVHKGEIYDLFHSVYEPFLTTEEVDGVLGGKDINLRPEQVRTRIDNVVEDQKDNNNNENTDEPKQQSRPAKKVGRKSR